MTKKAFLEGYTECVQRIKLKEKQPEGKWIPDRLSKEITDLQERRDAIIAAIETAPTPEMRVVLEARYISGLTVERTALQLGYSTRSIHRLTNAALQSMCFPADVA